MENTQKQVLATKETTSAKTVIHEITDLGQASTTTLGGGLFYFELHRSSPGPKC